MQTRFGLPVMRNEYRAEDAIKLFSEHSAHARHLESYLLSFTQLFLVVTGALWGYALSRSTSYMQDPLVILIFGFHLGYSLLGELFSVRLSVNFWAHHEVAASSLRDAGLSKYIALVRPENAEGKIETNSISKKLWVLLTAKAYFILIYVGAAAIDAFYLVSLWWGNSWKVAGGAFLAVTLFVSIAWIAYRLSTRNVEAETPSTVAEKSTSTKPKSQRSP